MRLDKMLPLLFFAIEEKGLVKMCLRSLLLSSVKTRNSILVKITQDNRCNILCLMSQHY